MMVVITLVTPLGLRRDHTNTLMWKSHESSIEENGEMSHAKYDEDDSAFIRAGMQMKDSVEARQVGTADTSSNGAEMKASRLNT